MCQTRLTHALRRLSDSIGECRHTRIGPSTSRTVHPRYGTGCRVAQQYGTAVARQYGMMYEKANRILVCQRSLVRPLELPARIRASLTHPTAVRSHSSFSTVIYEPVPLHARTHSQSRSIWHCQTLNEHAVSNCTQCEPANRFPSCSSIAASHCSIWRSRVRVDLRFC